MEQSEISVAKVILKIFARSTDVSEKKQYILQIYTSLVVPPIMSLVCVEKPIQRHLLEMRGRLKTLFPMLTLFPTKLPIFAVIF